MHCVKALSTSRTLRITRHNFTVQQGDRLPPVPAPDWPVMDGVDSYKPSTKWSNTKVKVEAASVVRLTMEGLHSWKMLFILNTSSVVVRVEKGFSHLKPAPLLNRQTCLKCQSENTITIKKSNSLKRKSKLARMGCLHGNHSGSLSSCPPSHGSKKSGIKPSAAALSSRSEFFSIRLFRLKTFLRSFSSSTSV